MDIRYYIGIDVSKSTLDWAVYANQRIVWRRQPSPKTHRPLFELCSNNFMRYQALITQPVSSVWSIPGCTMPMPWEVLFQAQLRIWLEASLHIKQAGGFQRGKSDSVDAQRIAEYAYRFRDRLRLWLAPTPCYEKASRINSASVAVARHDQSLESASG